MVERVAAEENLPIVRTEVALRAAPSPTFPDYDMTHPNAEGARVIGGVLFEDLRGRGWLQVEP